jgi:hypothetical protein
MAIAYSGRYDPDMARRSTCDVLEPTREPRWLVTRTAHRGVLHSELIAPGTDLKRLFLATMIERIDSGWVIREFTSTSGNFSCGRADGGERLQVGIEASDPVKRQAGATRP